jgi:LysM repeat protein
MQIVLASVLAVAALVTATGFALAQRSAAAARATNALTTRDEVRAAKEGYTAESVVYMEIEGSPGGLGQPPQRLVYRPAQSFTESLPAPISVTPIPQTTLTPLTSTDANQNLQERSDDPYSSARSYDVEEPVLPGVSSSPTDAVEQGNDVARPVAVPSMHTVEPGDTLWAIGLRYGTTWPELAELNAIPNPDLIYPGQAIHLPNFNTDSSDAVLTSAAEEAPATVPGTYTVQPGDTLFAIGQRHGIQWPVLAAVNNLPNPDLIYPGEQLVLSQSGYQAPASALRLVRPVSQPVQRFTPPSAAPAQAPVVRQTPPAYAPAPAGSALQTGIATWYGPGFEGNRTACGQIYDSRQYTAASNTLPCGTVVTVMNQTTGASVTVTITDRGAFTHAMDLSHAAFSAIANPSAGVAPIVVTAVK